MTIKEIVENKVQAILKNIDTVRYKCPLCGCNNKISSGKAIITYSDTHTCSDVYLKCKCTYDQPWFFVGAEQQ